MGCRTLELATDDRQAVGQPTGDGSLLMRQPLARLGIIAVSWERLMRRSLGSHGYHPRATGGRVVLVQRGWPPLQGSLSWCLWRSLVPYQGTG